MQTSLIARTDPVISHKLYAELTHKKHKLTVNLLDLNQCKGLSGHRKFNVTLTPELKSLPLSELWRIFSSHNPNLKLDVNEEKKEMVLSPGDKPEGHMTSNLYIRGKFGSKKKIKINLNPSDMTQSRGELKHKSFGGLSTHAVRLMMPDGPDNISRMMQILKSSTFPFYVSLKERSLSEALEIQLKDPLPANQNSVIDLLKSELPLPLTLYGTKIDFEFLEENSTSSTIMVKGRWNTVSIKELIEFVRKHNIQSCIKRLVEKDLFYLTMVVDILTAVEKGHLTIQPRGTETDLLDIFICHWIIKSCEKSSLTSTTQLTDELNWLFKLAMTFAMHDLYSVKFPNENPQLQKDFESFFGKDPEKFKLICQRYPLIYESGEWKFIRPEIQAHLVVCKQALGRDDEMESVLERLSQVQI